MSGEGRGAGRGEVYRQLRTWHGYLSAFAFLALLFFSATGILLNHPDALRVRVEEPSESTTTLAPAELAAVRAAEEPGAALAEIVGKRTPLAGAFKDGEVSGDDLFVRLQGVRGSSDLRANLATGQVEVTVERQHPIAVLNGLHRAELAGGPWRLFVDVIGGVLIVMSLIGYAIFLSLRFRLRTALGLTAFSLALMVGLFLFAVT